MSGGGSSGAADSRDAELPPAAPTGLGVEGDPGDDEEMEGDEEELEIEEEWVDAGVFVDGSGMPDGEPLPGENVETPAAAGSQTFARVGIPEFVASGLGMGPGWCPDRYIHRPVRKQSATAEVLEVQWQAATGWTWSTADRPLQKPKHTTRGRVSWGSVGVLKKQAQPAPRWSTTSRARGKPVQTAEWSSSLGFLTTVSGNGLDVTSLTRREN